MPLPGRREAKGALCYILHQFRCTERDGFRPTPQPLASGEMRDTLTLDRLSIHPLDSAGSVRVTYNPRRPTYFPYARDQTGDYRPGGQKALALRLGERGQVRYNWRHGATVSVDDWWYDQWVVNVGYFTGLRADAFLVDPPGKVYSQLARLR